jgi:uncharacterized protein with ATP-grasp and redox domains
MKTHPDCIPCFYRQALSAARQVTADEEKLKSILDRLTAAVVQFPLTEPPPGMGIHIYESIRAETGEDDPYRGLKAEYNRKAMALYPVFKEEIGNAADPLQLALKLAVAGNVIDFGPHGGFDLEGELEALATRPFAVFEYDTFKRTAERAKSIFYVGDNAGEIVFDRLLIETLGKRTFFSVRGRPIINDVLREDAEFTGMDRVAGIVDTGSGAAGVILDEAPPDFLKHFEESDLVISKGQGNFESLESTDRPIFFLLKAKCEVVASHLGVRLGDLIVKGRNIR